MADLTYKYSDKAIIEGMDAIRKAHNCIDKALDELEIYAESQMVHWTGSARDEYLAHKKQWDKDVDDMKTIMTGSAIPALDRILENYNLTERNNANSWRDG